MCNNTVEAANRHYTFGNLMDVINNADVNLLRTLPRLPQWTAIATSTFSSALSLTVYVRTALFMFRHQEIIDLMRFDGVALLPGKYNGFINFMSYAFVAIDTALDIYTNIQNDKSIEYIIGSAAYTAVTGIGIVWLSGKVGTALGTSIGGPVGAFVGGIVGLIVGGALFFISNLIKGEIFK